MEFCNSCYQLLIRGELPKKVCGKNHSFVIVPYLTPEQTFNVGEILVDGEPVEIGKWKADVKKQYGL